MKLKERRPIEDDTLYGLMVQNWLTFKVTDKI